MAPIKRRGPQGGLVSTRLPVYTLNSVSTQAANKRLPNEAEIMDNALVSLERSFEKRPGFEIVPQYTIASQTNWDFSSNNTKFDLYSLTGLASNQDLWYYWHNISELARFLVVVNFSATSDSVNLFYVYQLLADGTWKDVTPGSQTGGSSSVVPTASREYITYNPNAKTAAESLKAVSIGSSIIILNTNVFAGFSSDTAGKLFDLGGVVTVTDDIAGRPLTYWSSSKVTEKTITHHSTTYSDGYERSTTGGSFYIDVTDFVYNDDGTSGANEDYMGQSVEDITTLILPPQPAEILANNSNLTTSDTKAAQMFRVLYDPFHPFYNSGADILGGGVYGRGKVYFFRSPYLEMPSGYYRVVNFTTGVAYIDPATTSPQRTYTGTGSPYFQRVRTPDAHSYVDPRRMPVRMTLTVDATGTASNWSINAIPWTARLSGTKDTNPGPSVFKTSTGALKHVQIKALAVFKNRLWFAAEDGVFSTQLNNFENLFIEDPTNIVDTDPIDIRTSSNTYNEILSLTPFRDFLFVNTRGNTQFQLMAGSANELTPTNVMIKPISYYATDGKIEPQLIGSQLYFFDAEKLYLFVGENSFGYASAVEVSSTAAGYLPSNYLCATTIAAKDTIAVLDKDNQNTIYLYTARFSGDRVVQSSFYRYILDLPNEAQNTEVKSMAAFGDYLYVVYYHSGVNKYFMAKSKIANEDYDKPRLDSLIKLKLYPYNASTNPTHWNVKYDSATGFTTFRVPSHGYSDNNARIVLAPGWTSASGLEDISFTVFNPIKGVESTYCELTVTGDYQTQAVSNTRYIYVGRTYKMHVKLSTLFVRDENNNIVDGVLNIRTGVFRHFKTGNYDIEVVHNGRAALTTKFAAPRPDLTTLQDTLPLEPYEPQGEFVAKIFGYSDTTEISIVSEYPTPCNITNMEFKGKFKQKYTTLS